MMRKLIFPLLFALAACATPQPADPQIETPVLGEGGCDAEMLGYLVGQDINEIDVATLPQPRRIIPPGTAVTMDYRADRTNIELDDEDRVVRVYCG
jgi:Peptidase inhibitor I78 family